MPIDPSEFRPELLSAREREVLDLAVEGLTDEQIAHALELRTPTVNSYWVRIRGKIGSLSRTEIVGLVLRHESDRRHADLLAEIARLKASENDAQEALARSRSDLRALRGEDWRLPALNHAPEAMLVCEPPGRVIYANLQAQRSFAAEPEELEGLALWELTAPEDQEARRAAIHALFEPDGPPRLVVGVERPCSARRRDGADFRAILIAERFAGPSGPMAVAIVREALQDVEALLGALRRPFVLEP